MIRRPDLLAACAVCWVTAALGQDDASQTHTATGALEHGDQTLESGEYADRHAFEGRRGQRFVINLESPEFDPYLLVVAPGGEQIENDDHGDDRARSQLTLTVEEPGYYDVYVTSYEPGEAGRYTLTVSIVEPLPPLVSQETQGELTADDHRLDSGESYDTYEFSAMAGQRVRVDLRSNDFDTYLILVPPKGAQIENDDDESTSHSSIETGFGESGDFEIIVTSYESGESGRYVLAVSVLEESAPGETVPDIALGERVEAVLERGDPPLADGEFSDLFEFDGAAGQGVRIELSSAAFDTYLAVLTPSGDSLQNDDYESDTARSVVELRLPESGRYRIVVTSYEAGETGAYALELAAAEPAGGIVAESAGRIYGLFAGIGDYPGKQNDLVYTADDAFRLRDALMRGAGMREADQITLLDGDVTRRAIGRAVRELGRRAGPDDTFVFFFSGHGDRVARADGSHPTDPDALDETLELYDGSLRDDELRELFADVRAGTSLILIDACFSGGFAKDLISVPGRMGLFSSEEDVTSSVAAKFQAGGYLAWFLAEGIADKLADSDGDGAISAIELSQYVYERYRGDVKTSSRDFVRTSGPRTGHQHLVVDRGSIGPYELLFR